MKVFKCSKKLNIFNTKKKPLLSSDFIFDLSIIATIKQTLKQMVSGLGYSQKKETGGLRDKIFKGIEEIANWISKG